jgi:hypothetical protein
VVWVVCCVYCLLTAGSSMDRRKMDFPDYVGPLALAPLWHMAFFGVQRMRFARPWDPTRGESAAHG